MINIKHMITFFLEQCKNLLKLKLVMIGLVIVGIGFVVWRIPSWFGSQNNLSDFSLVELISRLNNLEIINSNEYIGFNDSRIPFTFEYPSNWKVIVNLTLNRECCVENITLVSPLEDFRIYIDFFLRYNPYYKDIDNFVRNPKLKGNPFAEVLITVDPKSFYSLAGDSFAEPLLISQLGGVERPKSASNHVYQLTSVPLILGQKQSVYQQRGEQASANIILGKQNPELLKVLTLRVNYQVVNNSPELAWVVNQIVLTRVLLSIQLVT